MRTARERSGDEGTLPLPFTFSETTINLSFVADQMRLNILVIGQWSKRLRKEEVNSPLKDNALAENMTYKEQTG